jgi:hypothetical protein
MKPYKTLPIPSSEITPRDLFYSRRKFMQLAGAVALTALLPRSAWASGKLSEVKKSLYTVPEELTRHWKNVFTICAEWKPGTQSFSL